MKKILIIGSTGFLGKSVIDWHKKNTDCKITTASRSNGLDLSSLDGLAKKLSDLLGSDTDCIYHFAGSASQPTLSDYYRTNTLLTTNLLEALAEISYHGRIVIAGSAAEYGEAADEIPVKETTQAQPKSHYGQAKLQATEAALRLASEKNLDVVVARVFNFISKYSRPNLAIGSFLKKINEAEKQGAITVDDLSARRDLLDEDDVAGAFYALASKANRSQIYNVCSAESISMSDVLSKMIKASGKNLQVKLYTTENYQQTIKYSCGDNSKLKTDTGWKKVVSIDESIAKLFR